MKFTFHILFLLQLFYCPPINAQNKAPLIFSRITEQNGLSDDRVQTFLKDSRGFMWIGTANGLNRYDGSAFKLFKSHGRNNNELAGNEIGRIVETLPGDIWIATNDGLSLYNSNSGKINSWRIEGTEPDLNIFKDICPEGNKILWAASYNGLVRFDLEKKIFQRV